LEVEEELPKRFRIDVPACSMPRLTRIDHLYDTTKKRADASCPLLPRVGFGPNDLEIQSAQASTRSGVHRTVVRFSPSIN
jgi:hypothetical protein